MILQTTILFLRRWQGWSRRWSHSGQEAMIRRWPLKQVGRDGQTRCLENGGRGQHRTGRMLAQPNQTYYDILLHARTSEYLYFYLPLPGGRPALHPEPHGCRENHAHHFRRAGLAAGLTQRLLRLWLEFWPGCPIARKFHSHVIVPLTFCRTMFMDL